jgi:enamine deaminase RidA (YjgF/YER057c/UK114 family)
MNVNDRIRELGLTLPAPAPVGGVYTPVRQCGRQLYVSGQGPSVAGKRLFTGKVGGDLTLEQGQEAAKVCALNLLAAVQAYVGDLNRVAGVVKVLALVASAPGFGSQPAVINAASQLLVDVFGEKGRHARSAMGTSDLPGNIPVEIEAIFELKED